MISVNSVSLIINNSKILDDISIDLMPGEVLAIVGPNGAGKSTLLKSMAGDIRPDSGKIFINDSAMNRWTKQSLASVRGVLPQHSTISFPFTVKAIVMMGRIPYSRRIIKGVSRNQSIVEAVVSMVQIEHLLDRHFTTLSRGEQQRVHLARVLAQIWESANDTPRYLLLDEPTSALDLSHQHHVLDVARQFSKTQSIGVLAVLHDLNLAACYADRIAMMSKGEIRYEGKVGSVLKPKYIKEVFNVESEVLQHFRLPFPQIITIPKNYQ